MFLIFQECSASKLAVLATFVSSEFLDTAHTQSGNIWTAQTQTVGFANVSQRLAFAGVSISVCLPDPLPDKANMVSTSLN